MQKIRILIESETRGDALAVLDRLSLDMYGHEARKEVFWFHDQGVLEVQIELTRIESTNSVFFHPLKTDDSLKEMIGQNKQRDDGVYTQD